MKLRQAQRELNSLIIDVAKMDFRVECRTEEYAAFGKMGACTYIHIDILKEL
jgi:hypothetical protein